MSTDRRRGSEGASGRAKVSIIMGTAYARRSTVGVCNKPSVMKSSRKTSAEPAAGTVAGTQIGSARAKGMEDGRRTGIVGTATVIGWSDEGFHDLHWRSKFEKSQIISERVEKPDVCPLLPNVRRR